MWGGGRSSAGRRRDAAQEGSETSAYCLPAWAAQFDALFAAGSLVRFVAGAGRRPVQRNARVRVVPHELGQDPRAARLALLARAVPVRVRRLPIRAALALKPAKALPVWELSQLHPEAVAVHRRVGKTPATAPLPGARRARRRRRPGSRRSAGGVCGGRVGLWSGVRRRGRRSGGRYGPGGVGRRPRGGGRGAPVRRVSALK
jgi:hypothetical protein